MKLLNIMELARRGDGQSFGLFFENEGQYFSKEVNFVFHGWRDKNVLKYKLLKRCFEAERGVAFQLFGDKWRDHVGDIRIGTQFSDECVRQVTSFVDSMIRSKTPNVRNEGMPKAVPLDGRVRPGAGARRIPARTGRGRRCTSQPRYA